jgi:uncharacterized protein
LKIAITGATGFIGSALTQHLRGKGHDVLRITRGAAGGDTLHWDPAAGVLDRDRLEGVDAVVHLAGESIGRLFWTEAHKMRVLDSRVRGTALLAETLAGLDHPPEVLVSASAVGYYGDRGDEELTEESGRGTGFLAEVAVAWEEAAGAARDAGIRVVHPRTGIVLSSLGGVLPRILLPFRLGLGGRLGSGRQWWPWITLEDEVRAIVWCIERSQVAGPVNLSAPNPVRNAEFTETLARVLRRPALLPAPRAVLRVALPEMADELLLASQREIPHRLSEGGFEFAHPELEGGLRAALATG